MIAMALRRKESSTTLNLNPAIREFLDALAKLIARDIAEELLPSNENSQSTRPMEGKQ